MSLLFHHPLCPHSRFIRLALAEYGLDVDLFEEKVHERRQDFLLIDPAGRTPVLVADGGLVVPGAGPIAEWIDEAYGPNTPAARLMPGFVPTTPDDPQAGNNRAAWAFFERWDKPFLTLFSSRDPVTRGGQMPWQKRVPGAQGQPHTIIRGAGHFLQEDKGPELAQAVADFIRSTPVPGDTA